MQNHAEEWQAEVDCTLAKKQVDDTFKASAELASALNSVDEAAGFLDAEARHACRSRAACNVSELTVSRSVAVRWRLISLLYEIPLKKTAKKFLKILDRSLLFRKHAQSSIGKTLFHI